MKIEDLARPGLMAFGVAGLAATALLGFAAGVALSRDPEALRRAAQRMAREAARGLEQATLLAAQAREQVGDLWAEARRKHDDPVEAWQSIVSNPASRKKYQEGRGKGGFRRVVPSPEPLASPLLAEDAAKFLARLPDATIVHRIRPSADTRAAG